MAVCCRVGAALFQRALLSHSLLLTPQALAFRFQPLPLSVARTSSVVLQSPLPRYLRSFVFAASPRRAEFPSDTALSPEEEEEAEEAEAFFADRARKKRLCYYFTQGLCTLMEDPSHLAKFSHSYPKLNVAPKDLEKAGQQPFEHFLVLDLEGMVEILEFPVVMLNADTLEVVDRFHRFVRPVKMPEARIKEYIKGKYGRWGLESVWHDTAIPFAEVLKLFEDWLEGHNLWNKASSQKLEDAAFVTCGNWDVKTKIPQQCATSGIDLPTYFMEWINLKDIYLNFYQKRAGGMLAMLKGLKMPVIGTHHLGIDDAHNIARVLQRMISHGAILKITAKRSPSNLNDVKFMFRLRVK